MRHRKKFNHLSRTASHRKAMLSNMAASLFLHKAIRTTLPKAKALRKYVEPLITKSKLDTTHSRRTVFSYLQNKFAVKELFSEISQKVMDRPGGYTRILKLGPRKGDNAEMALIELVDFNEFIGSEGFKKSKKRRTRRSSKKTTDLSEGINNQSSNVIEEVEETESTIESIDENEIENNELDNQSDSEENIEKKNTEE